MEVDFAAPGAGSAAVAPEGPGYEPPDEIAGGHVDLGALTAEFLALGLDPYPRKPGVDFNFEDGSTKPDSPFAALGRLKGEG